MRIDKEKINQLPQLDRIEFYSKANFIKNCSATMHLLNALMIGLLFYITIGAVTKDSNNILFWLIFVALVIFGIYKIRREVKDDCEKYTELESEFFKVVERRQKRSK